MRSEPVSTIMRNRTLKGPAAALQPHMCFTKGLNRDSLPIVIDILFISQVFRTRADVFCLQKGKKAKAKEVSSLLKANNGHYAIIEKVAKIFT